MSGELTACRGGASHACLRCGRSGAAEGSAGAPIKCSMRCCGRWYHASCAAGCPLTRWGAGRRSFRCAHHYCAHCGLSGDSVAMVQCHRCPVAYHVRRASASCFHHAYQSGTSTLLCNNNPPFALALPKAWWPNCAGASQQKLS